jgi:hypothetical protein
VRIRESRNIFNLQFNLAKTYLGLNDLEFTLTSLKEMLSLMQSLGGHQQKVEAVSIAVAFYQPAGLNEQAAVWAGAIMGNVELDQVFV